jgi:hypothetical protein
MPSSLSRPRLPHARLPGPLGPVARRARLPRSPGLTHNPRQGPQRLPSAAASSHKVAAITRKPPSCGFGADCRRRLHTDPLSPVENSPSSGGGEGVRGDFEPGSVK